MRKIKVSKKDLEKRKKKIAETFNILIHEHNVTHNRAKILEVSQKLLDLQPEEVNIVENIAAISIDNSHIDMANKALNYMEEKFPPSCYSLFLRCRVYDMQRKYGEAIDYAERALKFDKIEMLHRMMLHNILGHLYRYVGDADKSLEHYEISSKMNFDGLENYKSLGQIKKIQKEDYSNFLFSLHNVNVSREKIFQEIVDFNRLHTTEEQFTHSPETHPKHEKIRVGYVSPDIRRHVVAFFSYAFFKSYDKSRFEVYIYAKNGEDKVTEEFKRGVDGFKNVRFDTPKDAAQKIKDDEIDILVDLAGHTANNCMDILAYKPAPIIISGIGWFNTTGFKTIDYFMVDKFTDPVGLNEKFFSEKLLRLQHSHFCYMWHDDPAPITPAPCVKNGYITFVSFNNLTKVTDEMFKIWGKILAAVPNSKLYLKGKAFRDKYGTDYMLGRIEAAGIPLDRLIYEADEPKYLVKYNRADIALDTFPYPGGGTTCDALYMGLPVITLVGDRHNSRFGYSLLHNMGLDELCTFSEEEYINKAVELANDWDKVRDYHLTLRRQMETSPIMNDVIYMAEVESAYEKIFHAWQNGEELPEFPQDAEEITPELAEQYYNRAQKYISLERKEKNIVNVKRALYYFEFASHADKKHDAEIYLFMAACKQELLDYVGAYDAIVECGKIIYNTENVEEEFSREFLCDYHERRGKLALYNGYAVDAAENYDKAAQFADGDRRFSLSSSALLSLHFLDLSSEDTAAAHFEYQNLVEDIKPFDKYHEPNERIKVGYLSADFRQHAMFNVAYGLIGCHDKNKFEVTCYSRNETDDVFTKIFENNVEHFERVKDLSYSELAEKIHDDKIDILVDLSGHSSGNALPALAYKPAPLQLSGLGYMATTGMKTIDYFITDQIVDPVGEHDKYFSEKLLYLPSQFCYAKNSDASKPESAPCVKNGYVTFGTICRYSKINDDMLNIWKMILERVPTAKLVMRAQEFASLQTVSQLYSRMKEIGFNMDNVSFFPAVDRYLEKIKDLDLILDAFPYVGGSTTLDAIYMGVPVLTLYSERRSTRFGLSILTNIGLKDLAVNSVEDYINRAVGLASDTETLDVLHKNLRTMLEKSNPLNTYYYTKLLEQVYIDTLKKK